MSTPNTRSEAALLYWRFPDASNKPLWAMKAIPAEHLQAAHDELESSDDMELLRSIEGYSLEDATKIADDVWDGITRSGLRADRAGHQVSSVDTRRRVRGCDPVGYTDQRGGRRVPFLNTLPRFVTG